MEILADVVLPIHRLEEFVQTAVAQAVTADVADLVKPGGQTLRAEPKNPSRPLI